MIDLTTIKVVSFNSSIASLSDRNLKLNNVNKQLTTIFIMLALAGGIFVLSQIVKNYSDKKIQEEELD